MILADTMLWFFVIVGLLICFNAVWLMCRAIWEPLVMHARDAHYDGMWKSFFLGLPLTAGVVVLFGALVNNKQGPWALIGLALAGAFLLFTSIGVSGIAGLIGEKLGGNKTGEVPWKETLRGGTVLVLTFLFPFLGWLVVMPVAIVVGCGSTMRAMFREFKCSREEKRLARQRAAPPVVTQDSPDVKSDIVDMDR